MAKIELFAPKTLNGGRPVNRPKLALRLYLTVGRNRKNLGWVGEAKLFYLFSRPWFVFYKNNGAGNCSYPWRKAIIPRRAFTFHFYENVCFSLKREKPAKRNE